MDTPVETIKDVLSNLTEGGKEGVEAASTTTEGAAGSSWGMRLRALLWILVLAFTFTHATIRAISIIYPGFKSYKALKSRNMRLAHEMLLYLCVTTFLNALKEMADQILGRFSSSLVWRAATLALTLAPMLIGPARLYNVLIAPLFAIAEPQVETVVDELHRVQVLAKDAISAVKSADTEKLTERAGDIAGVIAEDSKELMATLKEQAVSAGETAHAKAAQLGWRWWEEGIVSMLDAWFAQLEKGRDELQARIIERWNAPSPAEAPKKPKEVPSDTESKEKTEEEEEEETVEEEVQEVEEAPGGHKPSEGEAEEQPPAESPTAAAPSATLRKRSKTRRDDRADEPASANIGAKSKPLPVPAPALSAPPAVSAPAGATAPTAAKARSVSRWHHIFSGVLAKEANEADASKSVAEKKESGLSAEHGERKMAEAAAAAASPAAEHHAPPHRSTLRATTDTGGHKHAPTSFDTTKSTNKAATTQAVSKAV